MPNAHTVLDAFLSGGTSLGGESRARGRTGEGALSPLPPSRARGLRADSLWFETAQIAKHRIPRPPLDHLGVGDQATVRATRAPVRRETSANGDDSWIGRCSSTAATKPSADAVLDDPGVSERVVFTLADEEGV
jgi:hypothetical protein